MVLKSRFPSKALDNWLMSRENGPLQGSELGYTRPIMALKHINRKSYFDTKFTSMVQIKEIWRNFEVPEIAKIWNPEEVYFLVTRINYVSNLAHTYFLLFSPKQFILNNHYHCFKCIFLYCMTLKIGLMWTECQVIQDSHH